MNKILKKKYLTNAVIIAVCLCLIAGLALLNSGSTEADQLSETEAGEQQSTASAVQETQQAAEEAASGETASETSSAEEMSSEDTGYETRLFDSSFVHEVNITISEADWEDLNLHAMLKKDYTVDIEIDGETFENVTVSTKGGETLRRPASDPTNLRYSLKVKFGKNDKDQSYYGLDVLHLNNNYTDASYLRDWLAYDMFRQMGVPAPLISYTEVRINGQLLGLYTAVEGTDESWLSRNFDGEGELYKPELTSSALDFEIASEVIDEGISDGTITSYSEARTLISAASAAADEAAEDGDSPAYTGAELIYIDDDPDSYPDIFDNALTDCSSKDEKHLISALKKLSQGDAAEVLDTDELLRYFAVDVFTLNGDGYNSSKCHNFLLYENDGVLALYPWDYNFTTFTLSENVKVYFAAESIEQGIDSICVKTDMEDRPLCSWIFSDDEWTEQYHAVMDTLLTDYFESGRYETVIDTAAEMIRPYVEADPTAPCTMEEHEEAVEEVKEFCRRRTEIVRAQLNGELPTVTEE